MKMSFSVIFLVVSGFAVSQAAAVGDLKNGNRQSDIQVTIPTVLENSGLKSMQESLRAAHMKLQSNQIEGSEIRNEKHMNEAQIQSQFHSQDLQSTGAPLNRDQSLHQARDYTQGQSLFQSRDNIRDQSMFQSQRNSFPTTTTTISSTSTGNDEIQGELSYQQQMHQRNTDNNQQIYNSNIHSMNQQQFYEDKQQTSDDQQFYNSRQQSPTQQQLFAVRQQSSSQQVFPDRQNAPSQQQFYNVRHQAVSQQQQIYHPRDQLPVQQQQLFNAGQQPQEQQKIYSNVQSMDINGQRINLNDQSINLNHQFQGVAVHQSQIRSERPIILSQDALTQMQSKGVSKGVQLSAFDNREHALVLPPTSVRSSVIVSGLKNLPMLPAMVYNGGPVPTAHAIAYGRDGYYKGSAALSQQLQTPYVRYVYSHIL